MAHYKEDIARIDLETGTVFRSFMSRSIGEGDIGADRFGVEVYRAGVPETLTGASCIGYFIRAAGDTVAISGGTVSGNRAYITLPQACYAYEGNFSLAIKLVGGNVTGTLRIVDGTVARTTTETVIDPGDVVPDLTTLLAQIERLEAANDTAESFFPTAGGTAGQLLSKTASGTAWVDAQSGGETETYNVIYGVTSYSEIMEEIGNGLIPYCKKPGTPHLLLWYSAANTTANTIAFSAALENLIMTATVDDDDDWTYSEVTVSGGGDGVFTAIYGTTTFSAVQSAVNNGKFVVATFGNDVYALATKSSARFTFFNGNISQNQPTLLTIYVDSETGWDNAGYSLQPKLTSGTNIKTINNQSLLGAGNITVIDPEALTEYAEQRYGSGVEGGYVSLTGRFEFKGYLDKNGALHPGTQAVTDFIAVKQGQHLYFRGVESYAQSYGLCLYSEPDESAFTEGVDICDSAHDWQRVDFDYVFEEDGYIRLSSMQNASGFNSAAVISADRENAYVFRDIYQSIGDVGTAYEDITEDVLDGTNAGYLNDDGDFVSNAAAWASDFIEVHPGEVYQYYLYALYARYNVHLYDERKKQYSRAAQGSSAYASGTVTIPPLAKYMRVATFNPTTKENFYIKRLGRNNLVDMIQAAADKKFDNPAAHADVTGERTEGYLKSDGGISTSSSYSTSDYIDLTKYEWLKCKIKYGWNAQGYVIYDADKAVLYAKSASTQAIETFHADTADIIAVLPTAKYIRFTGDSTGKDLITVFANEVTADMGKALRDAVQCGNILYGKKIAFCGDSFTEASNLGDDSYDPFYNCYKSYGWQIANRNAMLLYHDGVGGSTMHVTNPSSPNTNYPFAYTRYQAVPEDCDYIILQFGLNESSIADSDATKGTKNSTDTTTMWGSWNTVLEYLITNRPLARIGVVMSDAWMPQSYYTTLKEICEWWGIPLLDLGGDPNVPVMIGGRRNESGLTLNPTVKALRNAAFCQSDSNNHPNYNGHLWRSTVIENFIRSL